MARKTLIAGNWKMHLSPSEGSSLVASLAAGTASTVAEVLVCPTFIGISEALAAAKVLPCKSVPKTATGSPRVLSPAN